MKKISKTLFSLISSAILILTLPLTAFAADSTITFEGKSTEFTFKPGSEYTTTDLFDNFKDVMPGDVVSEEITIKNNASDCDYIHLYIRAIVHDENGNPLTYSEAFENADGNDQAGIDGRRDETTATMADFLSQLSMKVYNNEALIYEASPDELDGLANNIFLGTYRHGDTGKLIVELEIPLSLGNEYANRVGEVDWVLTVEALDDPVPLVQETPAPTPGVISPQTGDDSNLLIYVYALLIGAVMIGALMYVKKVKNREK